MEAYVLAKYLLLALLVIGIPISASGHTDMRLLRDVICVYETRGMSRPDNARGASDEIGRCQIRPSTARQMGFRGDLKYLELAHVNEAWALRYLRYCSWKLKTSDPARLAHCYNGGPNLPWAGIGHARKYAAAVTVRYERAERAKAVALILPREGGWI